MMVDLRYVLYIGISLLTIGAAIVRFFQMQTKQNMRLEQMERDQEDQKRKMSEQSKYQIQTEKNIIEINGAISNLDEKMSMIVTLVTDLSNKGCGSCSDRT